MHILSLNYGLCKAGRVAAVLETEAGESPALPSAVAGDEWTQ